MELEAEAAAHVRGYHPQLLLGQPDRMAEKRADEVRDLRRHPDRHVLRAGIPVGDEAPALQRHGMEAAVVEALPEDVVGRGELRLDVSLLVLDVREVVRLRAVV